MFIETESRIVITRAERREEFLANGYKASVWEDEKVLKTAGSDGYTSVSVFNAKALYTWKWLKWQISYIFFLPQWKTFH